MNKRLKIKFLFYAGLWVSIIFISQESLFASEGNLNESPTRKQTDERRFEANDGFDIKSVLQERISVKWENTTIDDAVDTLQRKGNLSFSARSWGPIANEKVQDVRLVNMKISSALDFIFAKTDFEWFIENDTISLRRSQNHNDYPPENIIIAQGEGGQNNPWTFDDNDDNGVERQRGRRTSPNLASRSNRLAGLIRNVIKPNSWRERDDEPEEVEEDNWW